FYYLKIAKVDVRSNCVCLKLRYSIHAYCILRVNYIYQLEIRAKRQPNLYSPKVVNSVDDRSIYTLDSAA
ncbi:hypothetical protein Avbf_16734, partial [Armadillidium vulgare]